MIIDPKELKKLTPLAEGGEGIIYEYRDRILKVYKPMVNLTEKQEKIQLLIAKNLPPWIISPREILLDLNKKFIGFVMDKVEGEPIKNLSSKKFIQAKGIRVIDILHMMVQIKDSLILLHKAGFVIGDLNDRNILFDKEFHVYFIDVDSWVVGTYKNDVCMETFCDPLLVGNDFNIKTDYYAYAIMAFKGLTRLHPFGGVMDPDLSLLDRMRQGLSVIDNSKVTVPQNINRWEFMNPELLKDFKEIFETFKRFLIDKSVVDLCNNLKLCSQHGDFYYAQYTVCPICTGKKEVRVKPVKVGEMGEMPYILLFEDKNILFFIDTLSYITKDGFVYHVKSHQRVDFHRNAQYYFSQDGLIRFTVWDDRFIQINEENFRLEKIKGTPVVVRDKCIYYVDPTLSLIGVTITEKGNYTQNVAKVAFNCLCEIQSTSKYFICNMYDHKTILVIDGYYTEIDKPLKIQEYGIHFDPVYQDWLFIYQDTTGKFFTKIYHENKLLYETDQINYLTNLGHICFHNHTLFIPGDKYIRGFNWHKNAYKEFKIEIVNEESKLSREGQKMLIINEQQIYQAG